MSLGNFVWSPSLLWFWQPSGSKTLTDVLRYWLNTQYLLISTLLMWIDMEINWEHWLIWLAQAPDMTLMNKTTPEYREYKNPTKELKQKRSITPQLKTLDMLKSILKSERTVWCICHNYLVFFFCGDPIPLWPGGLAYRAVRLRTEQRRWQADSYRQNS